MNCALRLLSVLTLCAATRAAAQAPTTDQGQGAPSDWSSTSGAKTAAPLPSASPMASDLAPAPAAPNAAAVPLPPPPKGTSLQAAPGTYTAAPAAVAGAKATSEYSAPGAVSDPAAGAPDRSNDPKVKFAADQTGAMVQVTQDLDSDKVRQDWAASGGSIGAFEANLGATLMTKTIAASGGVPGTVMTGGGVNGGIRAAMLSLTPPKYETRDTGWNAFRIGGGIDFGALEVTMVSGGYSSRASMTTMNLTMELGFMHAFGSFDSPTEWSGWAIGANWAPSLQSTTLTIPAQTVGGFTMPATSQTTSQFNATGFDFTFETGSLQSMAAKMGKKARLKLTLFFLPPVGDLPFLATMSVGATWY